MALRASVTVSAMMGGSPLRTHPRPALDGDLDGQTGAVLDLLDRLGQGLLPSPEAVRQEAPLERLAIEGGHPLHVVELHRARPGQALDCRHMSSRLIVRSHVGHSTDRV